jgi:hypothetical protein
LIERIQNAEEEDAKASSEEISSNSPELTKKEKIEKYLTNLVKYYIVECGGYASSRDLGRFLSTNRGSQSDSDSALVELKATFGGVASFLNQRSQIFTTVREVSDGDPMNYSFGIKLNDSINHVPTSKTTQKKRIPWSPPSNSKPNTKPSGNSRRMEPQNIDPKVDAHIEALVREYLHASGGEASSRNIGRYLAANAALAPAGQSSRWGNQRNTALKQLKSSFGSLATYINSKDDVFEKVTSHFRNGQGEMDPPSEHSFGVRLK